MDKMMNRLVALLTLIAGPTSAAEILLVDGTIHTMDPANPVAEALAYTADGRILAAADTDTLRTTYPDAAVIDLEGKTVIPGLIDAHAHLMSLGFKLLRADLVGAETKDEALQRLTEFGRTLADDEWLLGRGWDQNDWPEQVYPTRQDLDELFPNRPVWLRRIDGHAAWANSAALATADRDLSGTWQPEGGFIHRDATGQPTGILIDAAMALVESQVPPESAAQRERALDLALAETARHGLTGVHDAGTSLADYQLFAARVRAERFPLRLYAMADGVRELLAHVCQQGVQQPVGDRLYLRSVKLYMDGALGSRGAALLDAYADDPSNMGLPFHSAAALQSMVDRAIECGLQVAVHAIGDGANRTVLDVFENAAAQNDQFRDQRHRIEHAQILNPDDWSRFGELGVIASMQPTHATSDMYWAGDRLGEQRLAGAYAWRSLELAGALLAFGSDFPVEQVDPLLGLHAAVTRQDLKGWPESGWLPEESVTRLAALHGFTLGAAYAGFNEDEVGSLTPGKRADFVVLERDILAVPASAIPTLEIVATYLDGQPIFER